MNKSDLIAPFAKDSEAKKHFASSLDQAEKANLRDTPTQTQFFTAEESQDFTQILNTLKLHTPHKITGGYPDATRKIFCFLPSWQDPEDWNPQDDAPLTLLQGKCRDKIAHSDVLGSLMSLGITRRKFGDILLTENTFQLLALEEISPILLSQWASIGRQPLTLTEYPLSQIQIPDQQFKEITSTVQTLRLDSLIATGFSLSRTKATTQITSGNVTLNHKECKKPDKQLQQGDILVCRGYGKCTITEISGTSKKGRLIVHLKKYV